MSTSPLSTTQRSALRNMRAKCAAAVLDECQVRSVRLVESSHVVGDLSLANGFLGMLLALRASGDTSSNDEARELIARIASPLLTTACSTSASASLFSGTGGVLWALKMVLEGSEFEADVCQLCESYGELLVTYVPRCDEFDLVRGVSGLGMVAESILHGDIRRRVMRACVSALRAGSTKTTSGRAWFTRPEQLHAKTRATDPLGHFDLGIAHGSAGVIAFLSRAVREETVSAEGGDLLSDALAWYRSSLSSFAPGLSPAFLSETRAIPEASRVAWCYGDLGASLALMGAATALVDGQLQGYATSLASGALKRGFAGSGVEGISLCHGSAGNALCALRLLEVGRDACFARHVCDWTDVLIAQWNDGGVERWCSVDGVSHDRGTYGDPWSALTGAGGVALAAGALLGEDSRGWDGWLFTSPGVMCG